MRTHLVLCEGPDDLAALRAIGIRHFNASVEQGRGIAPLGTGFERLIRLTVSPGVRVELRAVAGAKSQLHPQAAKLLEEMPPRMDPNEPGLADQITLAFDPDAEAVQAFNDGLLSEVKASAPSWTAASASLPCSISRPNEVAIELRTLAWRSSLAALDGLKDEQNLDRLVCEVLSTVYANDQHEAGFVVPSLTAIGRRMSKAPMWKSALHLWCALVAPRLNEATLAEQVFQQHKQWSKVADSIVTNSPIFSDLCAIFQPVAGSGAP